MPLDTAKRDALFTVLTDPVISLRDAATIIDVHPGTVRRYANAGRLKCIKTLGVSPQGNRRRFQLSDVLKFIEDRGDRP